MKHEDGGAAPSGGRARAARRAGAVVVTAAAALTPTAGWAAGRPAALAQHNAAVDAHGDTVCLSPSSARPSPGTPWAQAYLDPESVWSLSEGAGVTVAVLGSGVDDASGMLAGRLALGPQEAPGGAGTGADCVGQGTFAAGLIAARALPGGGFAGIAPAARILAVGITDETGGTNPALLAAGIRAAADAGARVIDVTVPALSTDAALDAAVGYAIGRGSLIVAPYLVDGQSSDTPTYPAALPGVLSVADLGPGGAVPGSAPTPSDGSAAAAVDLAAPGDQVIGIGPGGPGMYEAAGPSYAAALVAGTAALVLGYRPALTEPQLFARLEQTADPPGTGMPDPYVGYGTIDPVDAVVEELPPGGESTAGPGGAHTMPPPASLVMPAPAVSDAPREAGFVAAGAATVILFSCLGSGIRAADRRRRPAVEEAGVRAGSRSAEPGAGRAP